MTGQSSTRSTQCPDSRRYRCARGCGQPAAWIIRPWWRPWWKRRSRAGRVCAESAGRRRADRHRRHRVVDRVGQLLDRRRAGSRRQGERDVNRSVDRVPGGSIALASLKPLHSVDLLDRRTDNEVCRTVEATAQHDRFAIDCGSPRGGGGGRGLRDRGALIVAESLWQRLQQRPALRILRMGRGGGPGGGGAVGGPPRPQEHRRRNRPPARALRSAPPAAALPSRPLPHLLLGLSITLTLPKSADKNLPEAMWAAAT